MAENNKLTHKQEMFCTNYIKTRNAEEAAAKCGFKLPRAAAFKLMKNEEVKKQIAKLQREEKTKAADIASGFKRLAFGCVTDAVELVFCDDISKEELGQMDLFNISEIKRPRGGGIEIKFFDRIKALEKLNDMQQSSSFEDETLAQVIEKSVRRLKKQ